MNMKEMDEQKILIERVTACLATLSDEERRMVTDQLFRYVDYLESVQRMPLLVRFKFYRAVLPVYDFLRVNRQLGRREGPFDAEVKNLIFTTTNFANSTNFHAGYQAEK